MKCIRCSTILVGEANTAVLALCPHHLHLSKSEQTEVIQSKTTVSKTLKGASHIIKINGLCLFLVISMVCRHVLKLT